MQAECTKWLNVQVSSGLLCKISWIWKKVAFQFIKKLDYIYINQKVGIKLHRSNTIKCITVYSKGRKENRA